MRVLLKVEAVRGVSVPTASIATLKLRHDLARKKGNRGNACQIRLTARRESTRLGQPIPAWALVCVAKTAPKPVSFARAGKLVPENTAAVATEIPEALRAWRRKHSTDGAVVQVSRAGVILHTLAERRVFADVAAAVAAVA